MLYLIQAPIVEETPYEINLMDRRECLPAYLICLLSREDAWRSSVINGLGYLVLFPESF